MYWISHISTGAIGSKQAVNQAPKDNNEHISHTTDKDLIPVPPIGKGEKGTLRMTATGPALCGQHPGSCSLVLRPISEHQQSTATAISLLLEETAFGEPPSGGSDHGAFMQQVRLHYETRVLPDLARHHP